MKLTKIFTAVASITFMSAVLAPIAQADEWNRKTVITFSAPVEIPGVHLVGWGVLPAGTYVFKVMDSSSDRHIVQIFNKDETVVYATILAIPNERLQTTDKTVITFRERPAGQPEALRAWFFPGRNVGEEFVYPKSKAVELAKVVNAPVLFTPAELPAEVSEPAKLAEPAIAQLKQVPVLAVKPTGEEVQLAEVVTVPAAPQAVAAAPAPAPVADMPAPTSQPAAATLPATASMTPLIGFCGLLAFASALTLFVVRKRAL